VGVKMDENQKEKEVEEEKAEMEEIEIDKIYKPEVRCNSNFTEEEFNELVESIKSKGLLQPIVVCKGSPNLKKPYTLLDGKNRLEAYKKLGYKTIPAQVIKQEDPLAYSLHVNLHRGRVDPFELAKIIDKMIEEGKSTREIAEILKISKTRVVKIHKLLEASPFVKEAVRQRTISLEHALEIQSRTDNPKEQDRIAKEVIKRGMSIQELREKKEGLLTISERKCMSCGAPLKGDEGKWFYLCSICAEKVKS
jgi:ParB family chromosome partitioning protein